MVMLNIKMGELGMLNLNVRQTRRIRNVNLEFKEVSTTDINLGVISIKINFTKIIELTQTGVRMSKKESQLRKLRKRGQQGRRKPRNSGLQKPREEGFKRGSGQLC